MINNEQLLTTEEYATLVETAHDYSLRHGFTVYLIAETGVKRSEAAHFTPEWLNEKKQVVSVPNGDNGESLNANHRARQIPLANTAVENLTAYTESLKDDAFGVSSSAIYDRVSRAGEVAGFNGVNPSMLRQLFGIRLHNHGVPIKMISEILGVNLCEFVATRSGDTVTDLNEWQSDVWELDIWDK